MKILSILAFLVASLAAQTPQPGESYAGCQLFPTDSIFHAPVNTLPVSTNPAAQIPSADLGLMLYPVFGPTASLGGFAVNVVPATQADVTITGKTQYWASAPVPANALLEAGGAGCTAPTTSNDCHLIVLQQAATAGGACSLYEAYGGAPNTGTAVSYNVEGENPVANLSTYAMIPEDNGSINAAGTYILPYLVTSADLAAGVINHALALTVPNPPELLRGYLWPAAAWGGVNTCTGGYSDVNSMLLDAYPPTSCPSNGPAAGAVWRLKASATLPACVAGGTCPQTAMILKALQTYGGIAVDNGGSTFIGILGETSVNWVFNDLVNIKSVLSSSLEPVAVGPLAADLTAPIGNPNILAPVTTYRTITPSSGTVTVTITATYGGTSQTTTVTVAPAVTSGVSLHSVSVTPTSLTAGGTAILTVTLSGAAPSGGAVIALAASDTTHLTVPASVTVPAGSTTGTIAITAN